MAERVVWMVCFGCGYRQRYPEAEVIGTAHTTPCPACGVQVLNVETEVMKGWAC